jgi:hypothetical protein
MALKPDELTTEIDKAFEKEWKKANTGELPSAGADDRRMLFAAVAKGVLKYLSDHQGEFVSSLTLTPSEATDSTTYAATDTQLNIEV